MSHLAKSLEKSIRFHALPVVKKFRFTHIDWSDRIFTAKGFRGDSPINVVLRLVGPDYRPIVFCSKCYQTGLCVHAIILVRLLVDYGIAAEVEHLNFAPCSFSVQPEKPEKPSERWRSDLQKLAQRLQSCTPRETTPAKFPAGREVVYVIQHSTYGTPSDALEIKVATRPAAHRLAANGGADRSSKGTSIYHRFCAGARALGASADALDRDIATHLALSERPNPYGNNDAAQFYVSWESSPDLLRRLAQSGRLLWNTQYTLHDGMTPLHWLCDELFDLKFEIKPADARNVALGIVAHCPGMTVGQENIQWIAAWYFIDAAGGLGIFRNHAPGELLQEVGKKKRLVVPREHTTELLEGVMGLPVDMGVEFVDCAEMRPQRVAVTPRPRAKIKAPGVSDLLELDVQFDYDGLLMPPHSRRSEQYDKSRGVIVAIDHDFHDRSIEQLLALGVKKRDSYGDVRLTMSRKKLPIVVGELIRHGWHVEAEGKLYRTGSAFNIAVVSGMDWFEIQGKAQFDEASVDLPRLLQALRAGEQSIVLDDGTIGLIPEAWLKRFGGVAEMASDEGGAIKFGRSQVGLLDALLAGQGEVDIDEKFAAARAEVRAFDRIAPREPPNGFVGTLRPYQKLAQGWFDFLRRLGFGGCLADDMGLGKTIQVLALLEERRQQKSGPSLLVVPRSLVFNWQAEAGKFAPQLRILDQSHSQRTRGTAHLADFDLVITTYGTLRRDAAFLKDFTFDYVVLDEAQAIKNAATEAAKAARLLNGRHKLALSGTPIENHLGELWSLFDFLNPGMLGRVGRFAGLTGDADADQRKLLAAAIRPFILRRTKQQVAPELPERIEQTVVVELDPAQRKAYDELRDYYRNALLAKIDTDGIGKSQIVILEALLRLRQAACHPGLIDKARVKEPSAKLDELLERLASANETGERVLVFSQFTSFLAIVKQRLKQAEIDFLYLDGKTKNRQALVEQFQSGTGPGVFLISLKAGGVGLNLTAARTVYLLDPWWNPAVEAQAIDRTHRIGQQQTVFAARLIAADTVEQKVLELQAKKRGLAEAIVNADNAGISSLTREDLEVLLT